MRQHPLAMMVISFTKVFESVRAKIYRRLLKDAGRRDAADVNRRIPVRFSRVGVRGEGSAS